MFDQQASNAAPPDGRLDKQSVQLGLSVSPRQNSRETRNLAVPLCHEHPSLFDLLNW
jgi:hypothetical protein